MSKETIAQHQLMAERGAKEKEYLKATSERKKQKSDNTARTSKGNRFEIDENDEDDDSSDATWSDDESICEDTGDRIKWPESNDPVPHCDRHFGVPPAKRDRNNEVKTFGELNAGSSKKSGNGGKDREPGQKSANQHTHMVVTDEKQEKAMHDFEKAHNNGRFMVDDITISLLDNFYRLTKSLEPCADGKYAKTLIDQRWNEKSRNQFTKMIPELDIRRKFRMSKDMQSYRVYLDWTRLSIVKLRELIQIAIDSMKSAKAENGVQTDQYKAAACCEQVLIKQLQSDLNKFHTKTNKLVWTDSATTSYPILQQAVCSFIQTWIFSLRFF